MNEVNELLVKAIELRLESQALMIIESGDIDPNFIYAQDSLLHIAIENELFSVAKRLIDIGAGVGGNCYGFAALHAAAVNKNGHKIIPHLLQAGAAVDVRTEGVKKTPLMLAAWNGHLDNAQLLIRAGADANAMDSNGKPVLAYAANSKSDEMVYILIEAGAFVAPSLFLLEKESKK